MLLTFSYLLSMLFCSEKDAQMSIYDASFDTHFGFCCHIDEDASRQLVSECSYVYCKFCFFSGQLGVFNSLFYELRLDWSTIC